MSKRNPWVFIPTLYFAEGLPYTIVMMMSAIYLKDLGADNKLIGLTSLLAWPWTLKFVWAPLVDFFGYKKDWVVVAQLVLAVMLGILAATTISPWPVQAALALFAISALASATHDVAIDAYYLEALPKNLQALFVGVRNTAYRLAWLFGSGGMVVLAGALQESYGKYNAWMISFAILSAILFVLSIFHKAYLPRNDNKLEVGASPQALASAQNASQALATVNGAALAARSSGKSGLASSLPGAGGSTDITGGPVGPSEPAVPSPPENGVVHPEHPEAPDSSFMARYGHAIVSYFHQPGALAIVFYILLFRLGDALMLKLASPFLLDSVEKGGMGMSVQDVGIVYGTVGVIFLLLGGILGGWLISKGGVKRWLWPTAIFQNAAILLYWLLALLHPAPSWVYVVNSIEQFAYGLGCAAYTVFMLQTVKQEYKAAHYAVATGMMAAGVMIPGAISGYIQENLGYTNFFLLSFFAAIPGIIAIFFLPIWKDEASPKAA